MAQANILTGQRLFITRLAIGLAQGLALYLLYHAQDGQVRSWPATNGYLYAPLLLFWIFIPPLLTSALGEMRWQRAAIWAATATIILLALAFYDIWSAWPQDRVYVGKNFVWLPHIMPSVKLFFFSGAGLFIAHALVVGGHSDSRFRASYPTHFDVAWKLAVQLALAGLFVGVFWLLLWLGASLFNLIKLDFFRKLIEHEWFAIPATTLAAAGALHLTDIRPAMVRGARTLLLTLLSWLLPLLTLIVAGFLASLPFTGLTPLWSVGHASALLLAASGVLIILINAAHQDGEVERIPPMVLRAAGSVAAILPAPLGLIASYALFLRVQQYGWTADRVTVAACVLVALSYAAGYARAAIPRGIWLQHIEAWNFYVSLLIIAILLALLTPLADPSRIAVQNQVARLTSGKIAPEKFDFHYLRWGGGRYGMIALETLAQGKVSVVREAAAKTLLQKNEYEGPAAIHQPPQMLAARITVHPIGVRLPQSFLATDWSNDVTYGSAACLQDIKIRCEALIMDMDGDGHAEVLIFGRDLYDTEVLGDAGTGKWQREGEIAFPFNCRSVLDALRSGHLEMAENPWKGILIRGQKFQVSPLGTPVCPK